MLAYEVTHEPGLRRRRRSLRAAHRRRALSARERLDGVRALLGDRAGREGGRAELDEFDELAQRIAFALLRNRPITHTITRENVLRSDSETNLRTIDGTGHLIFGMGTEVRLARLSTAQGAANRSQTETRLLTPVSIQLGYRRKLRAWGLDAFGRINLGTENTGIHANDLGGHVDYGWSGLLGLHFLRYLDATGVNSLYFGGGAAFELASFNVVRPVRDRTDNSHDSLVGGGLNLDVLIGYEFLRASTIHFYGQIELNAPTYVIKAENDAGARQHLHARRARPDRRGVLTRRAAARDCRRRSSSWRFALLTARSAAAQLQTCVEIQGKTDAAALDRLVRGEIDRHPTHRAATTDCQGYLIVEVIDLGPRPKTASGSPVG